MTDSGSPAFQVVERLAGLWKERLSLDVLTDTHRDFMSRVDLLRYELAEATSERDRLANDLQQEQACLASVLARIGLQEKTLTEVTGERDQLAVVIETHIANLTSEHELERSQLANDLEKEQARLASAQVRIGFLESTLTKNLRRPWLPINDALNRRLAYLAARIVQPLSARHAARLLNSARKRNPGRYLSSASAASATAPSHSAISGRTISSEVFSLQTEEILARYFPKHYRSPPPPLHMLIGSAELARARLKAAPRRSEAPLAEPLGFSIVTPFFAHLEYFAKCAESVLAIAASTRQTFEWLIVNDDPSVSDEELLARVPLPLIKHTRLASDKRNNGIAKALNFGIAQTKHPWLILLDCDDVIEPQALDALAAAIANSPYCRYFSSLMIDIDDRGAELRRRLAHCSITDLFEAGMIAGHLVAFRRDLHRELGGFDPRFSGVQDFDFALRASAQEQIEHIPQYLYRYRWHAKSQSIGKMARQDRLTNAVRLAFLRETIGIASTASHRQPIPAAPEILCIIRTQGQRLEMLRDAVASVEAQSVPTTPCIVVHADRETYEFVCRYLAAEVSITQKERSAIVLHAADTSRRRGHPCNVGLDYLRAHSSDYDLVCFLDDDDHLLPLFAERLCRLMQLTGADMTYGMANALPTRGEPFVQHNLLPAISLLAENSIVFNSFLLRVDAVLAAKAAFDETMHYLEDYDFLVQLLAAGIRAEPIMEVVAEYRLLGDGNAAVKDDQGHFNVCQRKVKSRVDLAVKALSENAFWDGVLGFPAFERVAFSDTELAALSRIRDLVRLSRRGL